MKKIIFLTVTVLISTMISASSLILVETRSYEKTRELFNDRSIAIHFYNDDFVIATALGEFPGEHHFLAHDAFQDPAMLYYLLKLDRQEQDDYLREVSTMADILYRNPEMAVISIPATNVPRLFPAIHGGLVRISDKVARLPERTPYAPGRGVLSARADIASMLAQVDQDTLQSMVQHLEDYGTRNAYTSQSVEAQNWIFDKFASYGLEVELHDFSMPGGEASDNVIATLPGTLYPDEYVVLGAHYDSYSFSGAAPGADDNATGTAGILEAARIMSQYAFDRTIIFAAWSGEEYGLYGSDAWATEAANNGMNILGYFNMDMAGYLEPGGEIHTDIIAPASANELRQFYKDVCAVYLPDFGVYDGALSGGDSDHTSFNQNGYMGIFPFEDSQNYSPHIHTSNDLIGPSVNSFEMHATFTQAIIANVATMADRLAMPNNLSAIAGDAVVELSWTGVADVDHYNIYRDTDTIPFDLSYTTQYLDTNVINGTAYTYFVTAVYPGQGEESDASNEVTVIPMPPISLPFFDDYESGGPYWTLESNWGLVQGTYHSASHSLTESPNGNYTANLNTSATLRALDFSNAIAAEISFWTRYRIESGYDYAYLEISNNGTEWETIDSYTGNLLNWTLKSYSLDDYIGASNVIIRFRFYSDTYVQDQGINIDDLEITIDGVGIEDPINTPGIKLRALPNPANTSVGIMIALENTLNVSLYLVNHLGQLVSDLADGSMPKGQHQYVIDTSNLPAGMYYIVAETGSSRVSKGLVIRH